MLQQSIKNVFVRLSESIDQLSEAQYSQPISILSNGTIGQHVRHIIELFVCLENGYISGVVNYENRKRDKRFETNKDVARELLQLIYKKLDKSNKELLLETSCDEHSAKKIKVATNYYREIIYNLEHTVHHMALIRIGFNEILNIDSPESYGVASSTIKYRVDIGK